MAVDAQATVAIAELPEGLVRVDQPAADPQTTALLTPATTTGFRLGVSESGAFAGAATDDLIRIFDFGDGTHEDFDVAVAPTSISISNAGDVFYTTRTEIYSVAKSDGAQSLLYSTALDDDQSLGWVTASEDGQTIAFSSIDPERRTASLFSSFVLDVPSAEVTPFGQTSPAGLSADGSTLAFGRGNEIVSIELGSGRETTIGAPSGTEWGTAVDLSADGSVIAFTTRLTLSPFDSDEAFSSGNTLFPSNDAYLWKPSINDVVLASARADINTGPDSRRLPSVFLVGDDMSQLLFLEDLLDGTPWSLPTPAALVHSRTPVLEDFTCEGIPATAAIVLGQQGSAADDVIVGSAGNDQIFGRGGNDMVCGGSGDDTITTDEGDDLVFDGRGTDVVSTGAGDDEIVGDPDRSAPRPYRSTFYDTFIGGDGDVIITGSGSIDGGDGNDEIIAAHTTNSFPVAELRAVLGGDGDDHLTIDGTYIVDAGAGDDTVIVSVSDRNTPIQGGDGDDRIIGSSGNDVILGGNGDDTILGGGGNDTLMGHQGDDLLVAGSGNDVVYGGTGADQMFGESGGDQLFGSAGDDRLVGGKGDDQLRGGAGRDQLLGKLGDDDLDAGPGRDRLNGGQGTDSCSVGRRDRSVRCEG